MRLIFLNRFFWPDHSATSQLLSDLAFHLAANGMNVTVATSRQLYEDSSAVLPSREQVHGVVVIRLWSTRFGRASLVGRAFDYMTFYASALAYLLMESRPGDLVVSKTDPPLLSILVALMAWPMRIRRVNWLQDVFPEVAQAARLRVANGFLGRLVQSVRDWSLKGATNVVLGQRMAAFAKNRGIVGIEVIPNWSDGTAIRPVPARGHPLRAAWGLDDCFVACYSGNLGRVHDSDTIVAAAERLRDESDVVVLFIGGGKQSEHVRKEAARRGLRNVVFRPYQERALLGATLTLPDIHLVSLRPEFEGLVVPSKYYGVAAAGRACIFIGDPHGEIAQLISDGNCGITVATGDGEALAKAILRLRDNPEQLAAMGMAARRQFEARFDKPIAMARWEALLRTVAAS